MNLEGCGMKVLEKLWLPTEQSKCFLYNIQYQRTNMDIVLKFDESLKGSTAFFTLNERTTKQTLKFPIAGNYAEESTSLLNVSIPLNKHIDHFTKGVWDAYLQIETGGSVRKVRVKDQLTDSIEVPPFYIKGSNKSFAPYSTVKGNLSFKCEDSKAILKIEAITLEENGVLKLSGYFLVPSWNVKKEKDMKKQLVFRSGDENEEVKIEIKNVKRTDVTALYGQAGGNYDWTGFDLELDFQHNSYGLPNDKSTEIFIKMEHNKQNIMLPLTIPPSTVFNKAAAFQTDEGIKKIFINVDEEKHVIALLVTKEDLQAEVDAIYSDNGEIILFGRVITRDEGQQVSFHKSSIVIKKRHSNEEYEFGIDIIQSGYSYTFDINKLLADGMFTEGIWDLYLRIEGRLYRLVTRLDGITNKQKLVSIPQQMLSNPEGKVFAIKPYYTLHEEVSIFCRDYLAVKSIEKVELDKGILSITGKLNIQPPNEDFPATVAGSLIIKGKYGKKYHLPVRWQIEKTGKTKLEFQFTVLADLNAQGLTEEGNSLLQDINFDLIRCEIHLENGIVPFTMNVDPEKVVVTLEDRLKQTAKYKERLSKWGIRLYQLCNKLLPINEKAIIFQSFHGKSYSCSPKALYEEMLAEGRNIKAVWVLNNLKQELPGNPVLVRPRSLKYYYYMAISKYFINNGNFPDFYEKREEAVHLQTWHGTPLKKLGFDIDPNSPSYAENTSPALLKRNERWDYLIGPNEYTSTILKRAFKFEKHMLDVGYPRNDIFYKANIEGKAEEIKKKINIPTDKKVILYAPTWRDYDFHNGNQHKPYEFKFDLKKFREKFGDEYVLLLRLHYRDATRIKVEGFEGFVYNVSSYDDIQELYLISDLLITDYSSVMFDYSNLSRPIIFFTYDLARYGSQVRGFYFDFQKEAPGPIVLNEAQLFHAIENMDKVQMKYSQRYKNFRDKFCHWEDGRASKRTIDTVFGK